MCRSFYLFAFAFVSLAFLANAEQWRFNITCGMLDGRRLGDDEDEIVMTVSDDSCIGADEIQFEMSFPINTARWKAIRLQRKDDINYVKQILEVECRRCSHQVRFKRKEIVDYGLLVLWKDPLRDPIIQKENAFYLIEDANTCFQAGKKYTFDWVFDGAPIKEDMEMI